MTSTQLITPLPARFSELEAGDLFLYFHPKGPFFCIVTGDSTQKLIAPFVAPFDERDNGPTLSVAQDYKTGKQDDPTVLSFGKNYMLQLSCRSSAWAYTTPPAGKPCILVTQDGDKFIRLSGIRDHSNPEFSRSPCYVDLASGAIHSPKTPASSPSENKAHVHLFVLEWQILTTESLPREIVACP